jgi:hypothetical protein
MVAVNMRMQPLRNNVRNARRPVLYSSGAAGRPPTAGEGAENFPGSSTAFFFGDAIPEKPPCFGALTPHSPLPGRHGAAPGAPVFTDR